MHEISKKDTLKCIFDQVKSNTDKKHEGLKQKGDLRCLFECFIFSGMKNKTGMMVGFTRT